MGGIVNPSAPSRTVRAVHACFAEAFRGFFQHEGPVLAGHLAFMALLSLFPFLLFLVALAGFVGQTEAGTYMVAFLLENLPKSVAGALEQPIIEVMQERRGGLLTAGVVGAVWTASAGLEGLRTALDRAYEAPTRSPYLRRRAESVLIVIVAAAITVASMSSLVLGAVLWEAAQALFDWPVVWEALWTASRYGLSAVLLFATNVALYWILPARRLTWRSVLPGAALALVLWLAAGGLFSLYLSYFGNYAVTYGSLGGVVVALLFFFMLAAIFIFGAEVNAAIARMERAATEPPAPPDTS